MEKHQRDDNKPQTNDDVHGWRRLARIANDELEKFRLNFLRCANRDVAPLTRSYRSSLTKRAEDNVSTFP